VAAVTCCGVWVAATGRATADLDVVAHISDRAKIRPHAQARVLHDEPPYRAHARGGMRHLRRTLHTQKPAFVGMNSGGL